MLAKVEYEELPASSTCRSRAPRSRAGHRAADARARRCRRARSPRRRARLKGELQRRRAGPFLSRRPDRAGDPGRGRRRAVYSSTQHPSEMQHMVAHALGVPNHAVTVECRRMGGGFGGKETQGNLFAGVAALAAKKHRPRRQAPPRPRRRHDRHRQAARFPRSTTKSASTTTAASWASTSMLCRALRLFGRPVRPGDDRALFHCRQRLFLPGTCGCARCRCKTNTVSNTAFRGFGGPQGMIGAERVHRRDRATPSARTRWTSASATSTATSDAQRHALPPDGRGQHHPAHRRRAGGERRLPRGGGAAIARLQREQPRHQARHRADAGEVRHLLHRHALQPGRRAGACLYRRLGPSEPRRHRDGPGPLHQGGAGRGRRVPGRPRPGARSPRPRPARCRTPRPPRPPPAPT